MMVERLGMHRPDQGDVVGTPAKMRQEVGRFHAALPAWDERAVATENPGRFLLKRGERTFLVNDSGNAAVQLVELRFGVEQVNVTGSAFAGRYKMHDVALGAKCGGTGAGGAATLAGVASAASNPSSRSIDARARRPILLAVEVKKSRLD